MPIDARIPLGGQPIQIQSPFEAMGQIAQLQQVRDLTEARRLAAEKARQEAADAAAMRKVLSESGGDLDAAIPGLMAINPAVGLKLQTERAEARQKALLATKTQLDIRTEGIKTAANLASLVVADPSRGPAVRDYLKGISKEVEPILPPDDTPESWQTFSNLALSGMERANLAQAELKLLIEGKPLEAVGSSLYRAVDQADWDKKLAGFRAYVPKAILDQFPTTYSPDNAKRAGALTVTPEKQATLDAAAARDAQAAAHQAALEANAAAQLGISAGNLGVARGNLAVSQAREAREAAANPAGVKLSDAQKGELATMMTVEELANKLVTEGKKEGWAGVGPGAARVGVRVLGVPGTERVASALGGGGQTGIDLRSQIGNIKATVALIRGGTSFTVDEKKLLESYTPTETDSGAEIEAKVQNLTEFIALKRANVVRVAQGQFTPTTPKTPPDETKKNPFPVK